MKIKVYFFSYTTSDDAGIEDEHEDSPNSDIQRDILKESPSSNSGRSVAEAHRIACELLSTEEQYVSVLSLIDQVCCNKLKICQI